MATVETVVPAVSGYVKVTTGTGAFLIENVSSVPVRMVLAAVQPLITAKGHLIEMGQAMTRFGEGDAYVKADHASLPATVVVSN